MTTMRPPTADRTSRTAHRAIASVQALLPDTKDRHRGALPPHELFCGAQNVIPRFIALTYKRSAGSPVAGRGYSHNFVECGAEMALILEAYGLTNLDDRKIPVAKQLLGPLYPL